MRKKIHFLALTTLASVLSANAQAPSPNYVYKKSIKDIQVSTTPTEIRKYELSANTVNFGLIEKNTTLTKSVLISNTGNVALATTDILSQSNFFSPATNCNTLAPSNNCAISITFSPSSAGPYSGEVTFKVGNSNESITVQGSAGEAVLSSDLSNYAISTLAGESSSVLVTLSNTGQFDSKNTYITAQGPVSITGNNCGSLSSKILSLAPNASCSAVINFSPTQEGVNTASFTLHADNADSITRTIQLTATSGTLTINPQSGIAGSMPDTEVGLSTTKLYTVKNTGTGPVKNFKLAFSEGSGFSLDASTTCPLTASTLQPNAECNIVFKFTPVTVGASQTSLSLQGLGSNLPLSQVVSGLGQKAIISNTPLTFSSTNVGSFSDSTTTISNTGNIASSNMYVSITGSEYSIFSNSCGTSASPVNLSAGANCTVTVRFSPTSSTGTVTGNLAVTAPKATQSTTNISLSAVSLSAVATLTNTGALAWGTVARNSSPATKSWTFRNDGNTAMTITPVGLTAPFSVSANNCTSVAAGGTCSIAVALATSATYTAGAKAITLSVNGKSVSPGLSVNATINPATMTITSATYGGNVGAPTNNRLTFVKSYCEGQSSCTIPSDSLYSGAAGGDPVPSQAKDLKVNYSCGGVVQPQFVKNPEAGFGATTISCP